MRDVLLEIGTALDAALERCLRVDLFVDAKFVGRATPPPLRDAELAALPDLGSADWTWEGLLGALTGPEYRPGPPELRAIGGLIRSRVLGAERLGTHIRKLEGPKGDGRFHTRVELVLPDEALRRLPIELCFDGAHFMFRRHGRALTWVEAEAPPRDVQLPAKPRILLAGAHSDDEPDPTRDALALHLQKLEAHVRGLGWDAVPLLDATSEALREHLVGGDGFDLLYVACHGTADERRAGFLHLRDRPLPGDELAQWIDLSSADRRPQVVALCACSSAAPPRGRETRGAAQWLVHRGAAAAAIGFRAPVQVTWALGFMESLFERLARGLPFVEAFADAWRWTEPGDPQWILPLCVLAPPEQRAVASAGRGTEVEAASAGDLPQLVGSTGLEPKRTFTGRREPLRRLERWLDAPGTAVVTAVQGAGGVGKTELAAQLASTARARGLPVVWLDVSKDDGLTAVLALLQAHDPAFRPEPGAPAERYAPLVRERLGPYRGLLVLDDARSTGIVALLTPSPSWNVLVTTREASLVPSADVVPIDVLSPEEALTLLSRLAWGGDEPPATEREAAVELVRRLGWLPLYVELAGATLGRGGQSAEAYLSDLAAGAGEAASDLELGRALLVRSTDFTEEDDRLAFLALSLMPTAGIEVQWLSVALEEPEPVTARRLSRLRRRHVVTYEPARSRYGLHVMVREAARAELDGDEGTKERLLRRVGAAMRALGWWVHSPMEEDRSDRADERWEKARDQLLSLDLTPWTPGQAGAADLAMALEYVGDLRLEASLLERLEWADRAAALALGSRTQDEAHVLAARGRQRATVQQLDGAQQDFDRALELFDAVHYVIGQATVLEARGDLAQGAGAFDQAIEWYGQALSLYHASSARIGMSNVHAELARTHQSLDQPEAAATHAKAAVEIGRAAHNRYAVAVGAQVLQALGLLEPEEP